MRRTTLGLTVLCSAAAVLASQPAVAQTPPAAPQAGAEPQTRAEALRREREEKQQQVRPYEPTGLERAMDLGENRIVPLLQRDGVYAKLGSLTTGSGFAYGAGFRDRSLVNGQGSLDLWAAASLKRYWALEARVRYPLIAGDRLAVEGYARKYEYPQEEYFGTGPDSRRPARAAFNLHGVTAGGTLVFDVSDALSLGGGFEYLRPTVSRGRNDSLRSVEEVFRLQDLRGFGERHEFVRSLARVTYDYRQPLNARRGGWYQLEFSRYDSRGSASGSAITSAGVYSFNRTDLDLRQYVSFLAERRVLAGRVKITTTDPGRGAEIPFFLLPSLGGNDTLRGFRAHRFRGPHVILLQGEYRWEIWAGLEAALFYDAGKVAMRRSDLDFGSLERDYGFGFRFNTDNGVVMRVDAAFGSRDGKHLHVVFGGIF